MAGKFYLLSLFPPLLFFNELAQIVLFAAFLRGNSRTGVGPKCLVTGGAGVGWGARVSPGGIASFPPQLHANGRELAETDGDQSRPPPPPHPAPTLVLREKEIGEVRVSELDRPRGALQSQRTIPELQQ